MQVCPKMTKMDPNHFHYTWIWIFLESCLRQMDKIHVSFYLLWGAGGVWVCCDRVLPDLWCSFVEIFRSHFTSQQITDKTKSVGYKHFLKTSDLTGDAWYTKSIYALLSYSIVWSLLCYCVRAWDHCCILCHDITQDMLFTWYIVHQPI